MDLERAIKRQAIAEWRDLQILNAAALTNLAGTHARAAFEQTLVEDALREALFNPTDWANSRLDAIMRDALKRELPDFWRIAADDLSSIDPSLSLIGEALRREDALAMPGGDVSPDPDTQAVPPPADVGSPSDSPPVGGLGWMARLGGRVATGAAGLATSATAAVNTVSPERLKLTTRLRSVAGERIEEAWMGRGAEPHAVLAQMIALIDEAAYSARTALS